MGRTQKVTSRVGCREVSVEERTRAGLWRMSRSLADSGHSLQKGWRREYRGQLPVGQSERQARVVSEGASEVPGLSNLVTLSVGSSLRPQEASVFGEQPLSNTFPPWAT